MAWYMRTAADANSNDAYLPKTTPEKAGCPGAGTAVLLTRIMSSHRPLRRETSGWRIRPAEVGGGAYITTVAAVETTATNVVVATVSGTDMGMVRYPLPITPAMLLPANQHIGKPRYDSPPMSLPIGTAAISVRT